MSRRRGSKFWLGGEDSESVDSSSIVFLSNSPEEKEDGGNARLTEIQVSNFRREAISKDCFIVSPNV